MLVLLINTGGSSSKFGLYRNGELVSYRENPLDEDLTHLPVQAQLESRTEDLQGYLEREEVDPSELNGIACRGGLMAPLPKGGVYEVNREMLEDLSSGRYGEHASNLSAQMGQRIARESGREIPLFVVDPVTVDELPSHARLSGVPQVERRSRFHALNLRHVCRKAALSLGKPLEETSLVGVHLGTGISVVAVEMGRVVDVNDALLGEGPFTVERAGTVPLRGVLELDSKYPLSKVRDILTRESGFQGYLGISDFREVEDMLEEGDSEARLVYQAFLEKLAKAIGGAVAVLDGLHEAVIITGGMAHSEKLVRDLKHRIEWTGRTFVFPGGFEMEALGSSVARVLEGDARAYPYEGEQRSPAQITDFHELKNAAWDEAGGTPLVLAGGADTGHMDFIRTLSHLDPGDLILVDTPEKCSRFGPEELPGDCRAVGDDDPARRAAEIALDELAPLVKVGVSTDQLMSAVFSALKRRSRGPERPFLSHVGVLENTRTDRLLLISDGGLNVEPDVEEKRKILKNAVGVAHALGIEEPRVALQAGMEDRGQDIPAINHARELKQMWERGEITGCVVDGPFGVDVALDREAARKKGIESEVAGRADIIITPTLEAANMTVKSVLFFTGSHWAGVIAGGPVPIVLGSRSDELESRLLAVALGRVISGKSSRQAAG